MILVPFVLKIPGSTPDLGDNAADAKINRLISEGIGALVEAAISLGHYDHARSGLVVRSNSEQKYIDSIYEQAERAVRTERQVAVGSSLDEPSRLETESRAVTQAMMGGVVPALYGYHAPFVYAKGFVFALALVRQVLVQIRKEPTTNAVGVSALSVLDSSLPGLKGVRDSMAHADERALGTSNRGTISPKPITSGSLRAPTGGILMFSNLISNSLGYTDANGDYAEVPITATAHLSAVTCLQQTIDKVKWRGRPHVVPPVPKSSA